MNNNKTPFTTLKQAAEFVRSLKTLKYESKIKYSDQVYWVVWGKEWQLPMFTGDFEQGRKFTDITATETK